MAHITDLLLLVRLLLVPVRTTTSCECGYTTNTTASPDGFTLFTEILETDFLHERDVAFNDSYSIGWIPQFYNTSAAESQVPYGMARETSNLEPN